MKRILKMLGLGLFAALLNASPAKADCVMPDGVEGQQIYNSAYKVMQFCDGDDWIQMAGRTVYVAGGDPPTDCPNIGDVCTDGSIFIGMWNTDPIYVTRCDAGMTWDGSSCTGGRATMPWNNGNGSGTFVSVSTDLTDGEGNTATLIATDSDSGTGGTQPHQAAQFCADLIMHGHGDWHLPSRNELSVMAGNRTHLGPVDGAAYYWSSTQQASDQAYVYALHNGTGNQIYKYGNGAIRCARR
ncbi:MAG: DUF1566 domain-containing protein [Rhodospirillales bacterium]|nr:DUF1566 domain-containing protein [Rhodospirillales bacterium]